jgi:iron complex outermembrane recepter protein
MNVFSISENHCASPWRSLRGANPAVVYPTIYGAFILAGYLYGTGNTVGELQEDSLKSTLSGHWLRSSLICFALCLCAIVPASLLAQQTGSINGTVLDPSGGVLPKATVAIRGEVGSLSRQATSDSQGRFSVDGLPPGTFTVEATSQGFANATRTGLLVVAGQPLSISLQLRVGDVSQEVTVSAADSESMAAQQSPIQTPLDAQSARSEFGPEYIQQFTSPVSDYGTVLEMAPGTFSISPNRCR